MRWARLRRVTFPGYFAPEFMNGSFAPVFLGAYATLQFEGDAVLAAGIILASLYCAEMLLARICGWTLNWRTPFSLVARDVMLPVMFVDACLFDDFIWHGNEMTVRVEEETTTAR